MSAVWPSKVGELLLFIQFLVQVHIALVTHTADRILLDPSTGIARPCRSAEGFWSDISMSDTQIFNMPMELRLELMAKIGSDLLDTKRGLGDDVVNKGNRVLLRMTIVNL